MHKGKSREGKRDHALLETQAKILGMEKMHILAGIYSPFNTSGIFMSVVPYCCMCREKPMDLKRLLES